MSHIDHIGVRWKQNGKTYDGIFIKPPHFGTSNYKILKPIRMEKGNLEDLETEFGYLIIQKEIDYYYYSLKPNHPEFIL